MCHAYWEPARVVLTRDYLLLELAGVIVDKNVTLLEALPSVSKFLNFSDFSVFAIGGYRLIAMLVKIDRFSAVGAQVIISGLQIWAAARIVG
jgi:hypothetical protein